MIGAITTSFTILLITRALAALAKAILRTVPTVRTTGPATPGGLRLRQRLVVLLLLGALVNGATFCSFT